MARPAVIIREARPEEFEAIGRLYERSWAEFAEAVGQDTWRRMTTNFSKMAERAAYSEIMVAERDGQIAGAVTYTGPGVRPVEPAGPLRLLPRDWAYVGVVNIDENNRIISGARPLSPEEVVRRLPGYDAVPGGGSNVIVRRSVLDRVGPFDARHHNTEDWDMWLRLARHGPPAWVPAPLLARRIHARNASLNIDAILFGATLIERVHGTAVDYGIFYRWFGELSLRQRKRSDALRFLALAATHGQLSGVVADLVATLRNRTVQHTNNGERRRDISAQRDGWRSAAQDWLDDLNGA